MGRFSHGLYRQLISIGLLILMPVAGWVAFRFQAQLESGRSDARVQVSRMAQRVKSRVDSQAMLLDALSRATGRAILAELARNQDADVRPLLADIARELPAYCEGLHSYTADGRLLGSTSVAAIPASTLPGVLESARLGAVSSPPFFSAESGQWLVPCASAVADQDVSTVVIVTVASDFVGDAAAVRELPAGSVLTILDHAGTVLFRSMAPAEWIGRNMGAAAWLQAVTSKQETSDARDLDGILRLSSYIRAEEYPWLIRVSVPMQEVSSVALQDIKTTAAVTLVIFGSILALGAILLRHVVQPIKQLAADAAILGSGSLSHRTSVQSRNEIGSLAQAFNSMAAHIQELHERLQVTLRSIGDAVIATDTAGRVTFLNPVAEVLTGCRQDEAEGQPLATLVNLVDERTGVAVDNPVASVLQHGVVSLVVRALLVTRSGERRPVEYSAAPIRTDEGKVLGVVLVLHDVSERRRAEAALRENEEKMRQIMESTDTGTWEWNVGSGRVGWSQILGRVFGLAPGCSAGTFAEFTERIHPDDREQVLRVFEQASVTLQPFEVEHRICRSDGETRWVHGRGRAVGAERNDATRVGGVYFDVTKRKEIELLVAHRLKLEELVASISTDFINVRADAVDAAITRALGRIGEVAEVDRAYVFLLSADRTLADNTHEWCAPGISAQIHNLKGVPVEAIPWWAEKMRRLEIVHIPVVAELPPEAALEKAILEPQEIQSLVAVPLEFGGEWKGFVGFDSVKKRKPWLEADILLLKLVAEIFARALEQRRTESRLVLLEAAVNASPSTMIITDVQGTIEWVNPAFTWNTGFTFDEAVGRNARLLSSGRHPQEFYGAMWSTITSGRSWRGEIFNRHKDGDLRTDDLTIAPVKDSAGTIRYFVGIKIDVTERKRAEEMLQQLNAELERRVEERTLALEEANRELEAFSYSVSHDLRAPLRHVQSYVAMLECECEGLPDDARRYLHTIADAARKMDRLIDDLLAFSRSGRTALEVCTVSLDRLVEECVQELTESARGRDIAWRLAPLPAVLGDRAMLRQVLLNLLDNAIKYTRPRVRAVIELGVAGTEKGRVVVFVRDNGVGFDPDYTHKLFGVFQRLHRADQFEGTGIGLANVQRIVQRHGGRTWAEGKPGGGATFYFTLAPAPEEAE